MLGPGLQSLAKGKCNIEESKMKNWKLRGLLAAAAIVTMSFPALAGTSAYTALGTITLYEDYGSSLQITTSAAVINPAACTSTSVYLPKSTLAESDRLALARDLLSAFLAGKRVQLKIDGTACNGGFPSYYAIKIEP